MTDYTGGDCCQPYSLKSVAQLQAEGCDASGELSIATASDSAVHSVNMWAHGRNEAHVNHPRLASRLLRSSRRLRRCDWPHITQPAVTFTNQDGAARKGGVIFEIRGNT